MPENFFSQFDQDPDAGGALSSAAPAPASTNYFSQFDDDPDAKPAKAPSQSPEAPSSSPALQSLPEMPGVSFTGDPALDEAVNRLDAQNRQAGTDAINEARGQSFLMRILSAEAEILRPMLPGQRLSQHHAELVKGVPSGAVSGVGTALQGTAAVKASGEANAAAFGRGQLDVFDRIDRGEAVADMDDPTGYQHMTPEQRQAVRADVERAAASFTPTPLAEQSLYRAGEDVKKFAKTILPAAPGYEQAFSRQVSEGLGSMAVGLPVALVGGGGAAGLLYGAMGSGEAAERAIEYDRKEKAAGRAGLTSDDINRAALWGVAPGATDVLPVEMLLGRLRMPQPFAHWIAKGVAKMGGEAFFRVGQQALVEGGQEGLQTFLQNLIASEYRADQRLAEDILPSSGVGAGVGGLAQSAQEIARLWLGAVAGRRGRNAPFPGDKLAAEDRAKDAVGAEAAPPSPAAPEAAQPATEDAGQRGVNVIEFIRSKGGLKPSGELDAVDAQRYPGLVSSKGLDADKMREAMVEAGYLEETGPDQPAVTTPDDVYDLVGRAIGGERIVPIADREADAAFTASQAARDEAREFQAAEQTFTIPEIARLDAEIGEPVLRQAYDRLDEASRREVIDRNRRGEDVGDLIEEMAIRAEDAPTIAAMVAKRGLRPEQVAEVREVVARERPELLPDLDDLVERIPQRVAAAPGASRRALEVADAIRQTAEEILPAGVRVQVVDTLGPVGDDGLFAIRAFHGTPHDFDRFDLGKIGTGEGAQVFGHGLYFAENEGVAAQYLDALGAYVLDGRNVEGEIDKGELRHFVEAKREGYLDEIIADYQKRRDEAAVREETDVSLLDRLQGRDKASILEQLDGLIANATRVRDSKVEIQGSLFEVDIDVEPHQLLDYDAKLGSQPEMLAKLETVLRDAGSDVSPEILRTQPGSWAYSELEAMLGSADAASRALKEAGIPGLRYLDQGSRDKHGLMLDGRPIDDDLIGGYAKAKVDGNLGMFEALARDQLGRAHKNSDTLGIATAEKAIAAIERVKAGKVEEGGGTRNIVIFDDSLIKITHKNGKAVSAEERQAAVDAMFSLRGGKADQTQTPEFKRWFGDSKVVDEGGKPLRVYHGTGGDIDVFRTEGGQGKTHGTGAFFSDNPALASTYASGANPNVTPVYLNLQNPVIIDARGANWNSIGQKAKVSLPETRVSTKDDDELLAALGFGGDAVGHKILKAKETTLKGIFGKELYSDDVLSTDDLARWARSQGYESVIIKNIRDRGPSGAMHTDAAGTPSTLYVAFRPEQIKSAIGNRGTFDPNDPRIAHGLRRTDAGLIAEGRFDPNELLITIAADALDPVKTLKHEGIHALKTMGLFTGKDWATLEAAAKKGGWLETNNVKALYQGVYKDRITDELLLEEAIAEQFSLWRQGAVEVKGAVAKLFQRMQAFLERLGNALRGRGFQSAEDVFAAVRGGEVKSRAPSMGGGLIDTRTAPLQGTAGQLPDSPARQASAGIDRPSQSLADLIGAFNKTLGLTVRQGRLDPALKLIASRSGGQIRGQASRTTNVIRLRVMQEFDTLAHEGGHALETRFKRPLEAIKQRHAAELVPLASPGPDALSEGFAEWYRRYVTNPVASKRTAPNFQRDFEAFIGAQDPAMLASLREIRDGYQAWLKAPSGGVVAGSLATTVQPGSTQAVMREINDRGFRNTIQSWIDKVYSTVFDDLHPINLAVQDLLKIAQANLPAGKDIGLKTSNDAYKLLRLGRDAYAAGHMDLLYGVAPYRSTQAQGPSFREAVGKAFGGLSRGRWNEKISTDFGAYLVSRRMVQEWARFNAGELTSPPDKFSLADHEQSIKDFEAAYPQFKDAAADVHRFLANMLKKKLDAGLITQELYGELSARKDYVPVLRDMTDRGGEVEGHAPARKDKQSVIKAFRGSQRDVINPLESIAKDAYETSAIIARNEAVKALDALARAAGPDGGRFAERIPAHEMKASQVNIQEAIKSAAAAAGVAPGDLQIMIQAVDDKLGDNAIAQIWRAGDVSEKGEPIVYLWEAGKRIPIRLADGQFGHDMLHAITGLNRELSGWFISAMSLPATAVRLGVTSALDFIGANYIRDQVSAWILTRDFVPFYDGAKGIYSDLTMKEVSRIYSRAGGIMGGANVTSLNESRIKREVLELRRRGIRITLNPFTRDFWRMTEFSESGTRIGVFQKAFDRAKADGLSEWEAAQEAAFAARDYIDFGRRGSRMLAARRLIPFFNAALQGLDRTVRGLRGKVDDHRVLREAISPYIKSRTGQPLSVVERRNLGRAARVWGYMVVLGMFGLAQSLIYRDDEEYEEISDYIRATHWLFKLDGEWVRIPKPFDLGTFSNLFERTFEYVYKDDPKAMERFADGMFQIVTPPHSMPGIDVAVQLATNRREITVAEAIASLVPGRKLPADQPIVGRDVEGLAPELQFNAYASEFGKYLGGAINVSPAYVDHFVTGFGASWGRELLNATNQALPALGRATDGAFKLPTNYAAETTVHDYFLIRRFMKDATRGAVSNKEFWELIGESNGSYTQAANSYKHLVDKIRDAKGAQEYLDSLPEDERAYALLEAGNSGSRSKLRTLHPLNRAKEIVSVASGLRKEINLHRLYRGEGEDAEAVVLSPAQMRTANDVLSDISMREARNALIALKAVGWAQKKVMPVEALWAELAAAAPEVHEIALERLKSKKLPSFDDVRAQWPEARKRLLEEGQEALLSDLYAREVPNFGRREYQQEIRP